MQTRAPKPAHILLSAGFALSCFGLLLFLWTAFGGPVPLRAESYRFFATYPEAPQLSDQADVRIGGVTVGRVVGRERRIGVTKAEIELEPEFSPIPKDAKTRIRNKTLIGETYVELTPGTPIDEGGEALPEGGSLPVSQTSKGIEIDEVLRALDPTTRRELKSLAEELGTAFDGSGPAFNQTLGNAGPLVDDAAQVTAVLRGQRRQLRRLIRGSSEAASALTEREGELRRLIDSGATLLEATSSRNRELTEATKILPTTLAEAEPTLELARAVGRESAPLLNELDPVMRDLYPTLRDLNATSPAVRALLRDLDPVIRRSRTGLPALTSIANEAGPLMDRLFPATLDLLPAVDYLDDYKEELVSGLIKLGTATESTSISGGTRRHILRVIIPFLAENLTIYSTPQPNVRQNPYSKPGYLNELRNGLRAFDCRGTHPEADAPPCVEQGPYPDGRYFPHVREDSP